MMHNRRDDLARQTRRNRALARPELGAVVYISPDDRLPEDGRPCWAWADGDLTPQYRLPFRVIYIDGMWLNAVLRTRLSVKIRGWNYCHA
jgi:hypothetical protein